MTLLQRKTKKRQHIKLVLKAKWRRNQLLLLPVFQYFGDRNSTLLIQLSQLKKMKQLLSYQVTLQSYHIENFFHFSYYQFQVEPKLLPGWHPQVLKLISVKEINKQTKRHKNQLQQKTVWLALHLLVSNSWCLIFTVCLW